MTITLRVQTSNDIEAKDSIMNFNTSKSKDDAGSIEHLCRILKAQYMKGNIVSGDLFMNVSNEEERTNESFFDLVKKGDN
jgi:hypothetical protein|tara:strand:- start:305 stop:544 length:240 start_codon:yes stop_codon:yes gene_type:complete